MSQKTLTFYFLIILSKINCILMIFGKLNPEEIGHKNLTDSSISPVRCSHLPWEIQKSPFKKYYSYIHVLLIIYVISEKNKL